MNYTIFWIYLWLKCQLGAVFVDIVFYIFKFKIKKIFLLTITIMDVENRNNFLASFLHL